MATAVTINGNKVFLFIALAFFLLMIVGIIEKWTGTFVATFLPDGLAAFIIAELV
jgi:hypothetical protein